MKRGRRFLEGWCSESLQSVGTRWHRCIDFNVLPLQGIKEAGPTGQSFNTVCFAIVDSQQQCALALSGALLDIKHFVRAIMTNGQKH